MQITKETLTQEMTAALNERLLHYEPHLQLRELGFLVGDPSALAERVGKLTITQGLSVYVCCLLENRTTHKSETRIYQVTLANLAGLVTVLGFEAEWVERSHDDPIAMKERVQALYDAIADKGMAYFEQYVDTAPEYSSLFTSFNNLSFGDLENLLLKAEQDPKVLECVPIEFVVNDAGTGDMGTTTFNMHIRPNLFGIGFTVLVHHEGSLV